MNITPPKADKKPKNLEIHNDVRVDTYWLNNREDEEVIDYPK
jgi:oligopeptidase B